MRNSIRRLELAPSMELDTGMERSNGQFRHLEIELLNACFALPCFRRLIDRTVDFF